MLINLYDAKTHLSDLVEKASEGAEIIIAKSGKPKAKLIAVNQAPPTRTPGLWRGKVVISKKFDDPLPEDVLRAFWGE